MSESEVQQLIQIEAAKHGIMLMRNNSGGFKDETGRMVFFGLGNTTKNDKLKSSDLIGIWPIPVYYNDNIPHGVNGNIWCGRFIAVEVKRPGWRFNPNDKREQAQKAFIDLIISRGGVAGFCQSVDDFLRLIGKA